MSTDSDAGTNGEMEKINVRVPKTLLAEIEEVWEERGYANKAEFIRDAPRRGRTNDGTLRVGPTTPRREPRAVRRRQTVSQADVKERVGVDD